MKRRTFLSSGLSVGLSAGVATAASFSVLSVAHGADNPDWPNLGFYHNQDSEAKALPADKRRVVFMGDSITWNWAEPKYGEGFLADHGFVGRGISGQTTSQMLVRFWPDVIDLDPKAVHILAGTNDVAGNTGPYDFEATTDNIKAMAALAVEVGIEVAIGSVPPAAIMPWRKELGNPTAQIVALNRWIRGFCEGAGHIYVDYWPILADKDNGLKAELGLDAVHPNREAYRLMSAVALKALAPLL